MEQQLDYEPVEKIMGVGVSGPLYGGRFRPVLEVREVKQPAQEEHRYIPTIYSTFSLASEFEMRNRTRVEIRDIEGQWSQRWQDRTAIGRDFEIGPVKPWAYVQGDVYWDTRYNTFNRTDKTAGARVPMTAGSSLDLFFTRIDDTRKAERTVYLVGTLLRVAL